MKILQQSFLLPFFILTLMFYSCSSSDDTESISPEIEEEIEPVLEAVIGLSIVDEANLDFGEVVQGISSQKKVKIQNYGDLDLNINRVVLPEGFSSSIVDGVISPGQNIETVIYFNPNEIKEYSGQLIVESNAVSGNDVMNLSGIGISDIYDGDLLLANQIEIENFINKGYKEVTGQLFIAFESGRPNRNTDIVSLEPLSQLRSINTIRINSTANLTNLNGLEGVEINGSIALFDNIGLENIDALANLTNLNGFLQIAGSDSLSNLDGLSNLESVGSILTITYNESLENLNGLANLNSIGGNLELRRNPFLHTLDGLDNLTSIGGGRIFIKENQRLKGYCSILELLQNNGIQDIFYSLEFNRYNPSVGDIENGLCEAEIPQGVYYGDVRLSNFPDYDFFVSFGFEEVIGDVTIVLGRVNNRYLENLEGWQQLKRVRGTLTISSTYIQNLDELSNLEFVEGNLEILNNMELNNYCGVVPLIQVNGIQGNYYSTNNLYNPSIENLQNGICSE